MTATPLTPEQRDKARRLDETIRERLDAGGRLAVLLALDQYIRPFGELLEICDPDQLVRLCLDYSGLNQLVILLDSVSQQDSESLPKSNNKPPD